MPLASKKVLIVGGGASGLSSTKICLEEGLEPECYELTDDLGGLWVYRNKSWTSGDTTVGCVMKSTVINTSKEIMSFSDFPIPTDWPPYIHNRRVYEYFHMYADHFNLKPHIRFRHKVLSVKFNQDTQLWTAEILDEVNNKKFSKEFGAVLACTGHHGTPNRPTFKGEEKFKGDIMHSHDYRTTAGYEDKKVLVIGVGNSGGDAANELSRVTHQTYLSTRRGCWILNRIADYGVPIDLLRSSLFQRLIIDYIPESYLERILNYRFDHAKYGLECAHGVLAQHPTINDDLPNRLVSGSCIVKPDIQEFTETGVIFNDGTQAELDRVVMATGYSFSVPYISSDIIEIKENELPAYKLIFPLNSPHPSLALIGYVQPLGALMPISELQCRYACSIFKGELSLPSRSDQELSVCEYRKQLTDRYNSSKRHTIQVDYVTYKWDIAKLNHCAPNLKELIWKDPRLFFHALFGPSYPYLWRLQGKHSWSGARDAVLSAYDKTVNATKTRKLENATSKRKDFIGTGGLMIIIAAFIMLISWIMY